MASYGLPPKELMLALKNAFLLDRFVETGTHLGSTAAWAAEHFAEVVTIEASEDLHRAAVERHGHLSNVRWIHGDTRDVLRREVARLSGPAIVWLDSHWCGGVSYGEADECPLLFEIETLRASPHEHVLFVDDARLFMAPPPSPHKSDHWPTLAQVVAALTRGGRPLEVLVLEDTFVAVPEAARALVWRFAQDAISAAHDDRGQRRSSASEALGRRLFAGTRGLGRRIR